jgi:hypothetical protein
LSTYFCCLPLSKNELDLNKILCLFLWQVLKVLSVYFVTCHFLLDNTVKLIFVLFFMLPGNNDELTPFVVLGAYNSQLRVGDQKLVFDKHALILRSILYLKPKNV